MKVTQIMLSPGWGGAERLFIELCQALTHHGGIKVQALCRPRTPLHEHLSKIPEILTETVSASGHWDLRGLLQIHKALRRFKPDIVHTHPARATWMGGLMARFSSIPSVTTLHNRAKVKYLRFADRKICITSRQEAYVLASGFPAHEVVKIPNCSSLQPVGMPPEQTTERPRYVAYGRFVHKKGFDTLLRGFRRYLDAGGSGHLSIGGTGPCSAKLHALARDLRLENHVHWAGWIEPASFLASADAFILPSRDEPFGLVLLEAMASGIPIIATRTDGPLEVLSQESAILVGVDDEAELAAALSEFEHARNAARARAQVALDLYRTHYTAPIAAHRTLLLYASMLHAE